MYRLIKSEAWIIILSISPPPHSECFSRQAWARVHITHTDIHLLCDVFVLPQWIIDFSRRSLSINYSYNLHVTWAGQANGWDSEIERNKENIFTSNLMAFYRTCYCSLYVFSISLLLSMPVRVDVIRCWENPFSSFCSWVCERMRTGTKVVW